jgi:amino acid permease
LYEREEISEAFLDLMKIDRNVYYSAMLAELAKRKWSDDMRMNNGAFTDEMKNMWKDAFTNIPVAMIIRFYAHSGTKIIWITICNTENLRMKIMTGINPKKCVSRVYIIPIKWEFQKNI